jgi:hypothetical protein
VLEPEVVPETSSGERQPGQHVDRADVRGDKRADIADEYIGVAVLRCHADVLAQPREVVACDRTVDDDHDRA